MTCCALPAEQAAPQCWPRRSGGHRGHAAAHHRAWDGLQPGICTGEYACPGCTTEPSHISAEPLLSPQVPLHKVCFSWSCLPKTSDQPIPPVWLRSCCVRSAWLSGQRPAATSQLARILLGPSHLVWEGPAVTISLCLTAGQSFRSLCAGVQGVHPGAEGLLQCQLLCRHAGRHQAGPG